MKKRMGVLLLAAATTPAATVARQSREPPVRSATLQRLGATSNLERAFRSLLSRVEGGAWAGYAVPMVPGSRSICCGHCGDYGWRGICRLEGNNSNYHATEDVEDLRATSTLLVLYRIGKRRLDNIRTFSADCELDAAGATVYWWSKVDPRQSLSLLEKQVAASRSSKLAERAIQAIALHGDSRADVLLETFATDEQPQDVAEKAIFWMGAARRQAGFESLIRVKERVRDTDLREQIAFALYLSEAQDAIEELIEMARHDPNRDARGKALFWLGQKAGRRAADAIKEAVEDDPSLDIKKKAVFALSQLPPEEGVPLLIDVARNHRHPEIRKKAMFWLGQSGDPRAIDFFAEILLK